MKIEEVLDLVIPNFSEAVNLRSHLHFIQSPIVKMRYLSYFNQPIMFEVDGLSYPFPCEELFCPSFNGKTSRLVDFYIACHEVCKAQWETLPECFPLYKPRSIKCEKVTSSKG